MPGLAAKLTSAVLAVVLAVVGITAGWAVVSIHASVQEMAATTRTLNAYAGLQRSIAGEAFAEAGYRRGPSAAGRVRVEAAIRDVGVAVTQVRRAAGQRDGAMLSYITLTNARYAASVRDDLDDPRLKSDDRVAGPALDSMQTLIDATAAGHRREVEAARVRQLTLTRALLVVVPLVMAGAFVALLMCWRVQLRQHHSLRTLATEYEHRSLHDPLTGLANRALFHRDLEVALRDRAGGTCVMLVDLDDFKAVNDSHGHGAGDQLLVAVADRLRVTLRGDLAARLGGDEFAVLLRRTDDPARVAQRLVDALHEPLELDGVRLDVSVSIGLAVASRTTSTSQALLKCADDALYAAKAAGKGTWLGQTSAGPAVSGDPQRATAVVGHP